MPSGQPPVRPGSKAWKIALLIFLLACLGMGVGWYWLNTPQAVSGSAAGQDSEIIFTVHKGSGSGRIAAELRQAGLLDSEYAFRLAAWLQGAQGRLKAGEYSIRTGLTPWQLVDIIVEGHTNLYRVVLPEGFTMEQIITRLAQPVERSGGGSLVLFNPEEALLWASDRQFIASLGLEGNSLEGYLFPDTYFFTGRPHSAREVLARLIEHFQKVWDELPPYQGALPLTRHQLVTLASIIEKETSLDQERPLVSAVYHNRLRLGMPLQADPTVTYGVNHQGPITRRLLSQDHPYNTYIHPGLPPGPICSPGRDSLAAALNPAQNDYLYFVASAKGDGSHNFTATYSEHLRNVSQYRRRGN
jgi:UPF0755 protein